MRLENKVIIVTGSCSGIGRAIAVHCATGGAQFVIQGLEPERATEAVSQMDPDKADSLVRDINSAGFAAAAVDWRADESAPISDEVVDHLEPHPFIGRNPPKDGRTIPSK